MGRPQVGSAELPGLPSPVSVSRSTRRTPRVDADRRGRRGASWTWGTSDPGPPGERGPPSGRPTPHPAVTAVPARGAWPGGRAARAAGLHAGVAPHAVRVAVQHVPLPGLLGVWQQDEHAAEGDGGVQRARWSSGRVLSGLGRTCNRAPSVTCQRRRSECVSSPAVQTCTSSSTGVAAAPAALAAVASSSPLTASRCGACQAQRSSMTITAWYCARGSPSGTLRPFSTPQQLGPVAIDGFLGVEQPLRAVGLLRLVRRALQGGVGSGPRDVLEGAGQVVG